MVTFRPRSAWTDTAPGFTRYPGNKLDADDVTGVTLHYPGDGNVVRGVLSPASEASLLRAYRNHHVNHNGWADIGYNRAIGQSGRIYDAAGVTHAAAHAASSSYQRANMENLGYLLLLGNNEEPSAAMIDAVNAAWTLDQKRYPRMTTVRGHGQVRGAQTACPGGPVLAAIAAGRFRRAAPKPTPPASGGTYTVRRGDTLGVIASRYGTSVAALQLLNGISDPDRIDVGQRLYTRWVVASGQTLGLIADKAGTSVSRLATLNNLRDPDRIDVGQLLRLP